MLYLFEKKATAYRLGESTQTAGALDRAFAIRPFIAEQKSGGGCRNRGWTVSSFADRTPPDRHLQDRGYIQKALGTKRYGVGNRLVTLSAKSSGAAFRTARRHAVLSAVADQHGEHCEIGVGGDDAVLVQMVKTRGPG